ncbi:TPA: hypothetical protein ACH3X1_015748 [Trebouxia sp. C0004]
MSAQLHLSVLHVIRLSCQTLHVSWAAPIDHDSCACHTTKPEVRSQCACNKSAGLHPNSVCQLGCTYQIPHGTQLTLSGEDMPGQMQSPGYKNLQDSSQAVVVVCTALAQTPNILSL